ncbi:hypothetical protein DSUL_90017 [Desulfovibrionales bacterium]
MTCRKRCSPCLKGSTALYDLIKSTPNSDSRARLIYVLPIKILDYSMLI